MSTRSNYQQPPEYDEDAHFQEADEALIDEGQGGLGVDPMARDANDDSDVDAPYVGGAAHDDDDDGYEGFESDASFDGQVTRRKDSVAVTAALEGIKIAFFGPNEPIARVLELRRALRFFQKALSSVPASKRAGRRVDVMRVAYQALELPGRELDDALMERLFALAVEIGGRVEVPQERVDEVFEPLRNVINGFFAEASRNVRELYQVAMMLELVEQTKRGIENGSTHAQSFALVLRHGLGDEHTIAELVGGTSLELPIESAERSVRALVERINALPAPARLRCLFAQICGVREWTRATITPNESESGTARCTELFDSKLPRQPGRVCHDDKHARLTVELLISPGSEAASKLEAWGRHLNGGAAGFRVGVTPFTPYAPADQSAAATYGNSAFAGAVITHQASLLYSDPTPNKLMGGVDSLLTGAVRTEATKLRGFLDYAYPDGEGGAWWERLPENTVLAVEYRGVDGKRRLHKIGRWRPERHSTFPTSFGGGRHRLFLDPFCGALREIRETLFPPWEAHKWQCVRMLIFLSPAGGADDEWPPSYVFSHDTTRWALAVKAEKKALKGFVAKWRAKLKEDRDVSRLYLTSQDKIDLRRAKATAVDEAFKKVYYEPLLMPFQKGTRAWPDWHDRGRFREMPNELAEALRKRIGGLETAERNKLVREDAEELAEAGRLAHEPANSSAWQQEIAEAGM